MFSLKAPAKVNWFLLVLGRRADGYHDIQSLMQKVSLYDTLSFEESEGLEVVTAADIPEKENLVYRAASALRKKTGTRRGARITLEKNIPIAAGMGGGSSDAACALVGLDRLWGLGLGWHELAEAALALGSDVPFFLGPPAALVEGRGEKVTPVHITRPATLLLAKPTVGVSAGWAYSEVGIFSDAPLDAARFVSLLEAGDFPALSTMLRNDLEPAVLRGHPEVLALKEGLLSKGALAALMSGSGSAVFGVFPSRAEAENALRSLDAPWAVVAETL